MELEIEMELQERRRGTRQWDSLPSSALVNIFSKTSIKDRMFNLPLVCKSWSQASLHPHCWASMAAATVPDDDDVFLKDSCIFVDPFDGRRCRDPSGGVKAFRGLIERAAGGASVTSLYFFPFLTRPVDNGGSSNADALLHLIAQHCPNLKHISFRGSNDASEQAISELIHSCKKLELVDFSDSPYFIPSILDKMSIHCSNLRGIRRNGETQPSFASHFAKCFPSLKLLNLSDSTIVDKDLLIIVTSLRELEYLDVRRCERLLYYMYVIKGASLIGKIVYD